MSDDISNDNHLEEWKEARGIIGRFDEYIHDIRKYGFTFLAGLIAADALQKLVQDTKIAFGLLTLTIVFIVALRLFEEIYSKYLRAASIRAKILETTFLDLEVTEFISYKYKREKVSPLILYLYLTIILLVIIIGIIVLPISFYLGLFIAIALAGGIIVNYIPDFIPFTMDHPQINDLSHIEYDWSVDRVYCSVGDRVKITLVNLSGDNFLNFKASSPFKIFKEGHKQGDKVVWDPGEIETIIAPDGNYSWLWDTSNCPAGTIYRIWPSGWIKPLKRSIVVTDKPATPNNIIMADLKDVIKEPPLLIVKDQS
jgi:hypothetical protein